MKRAKEMLLLGLASVMVLGSVLTGCGSKEAAVPEAETAAQQPEKTEDAQETAEATEASETAEAATGEEAPAADLPDAGLATDFTWMIVNPPDSAFYNGYNENPVVRYWLSKEWDPQDGYAPRKISVDFSAPAAGEERQAMNTLLATGEYPDVFTTDLATSSVAQMYLDGIALDLTDYVEKYMPNYMDFMKRYPALAPGMSTLVDGEKKYIELYTVNEGNQAMWGGYEYRRDWIAKYGKNPETGEAFHGEFDADNNWTDDVVFPSGGSDPIYISDWEWMFEIFETAMADLGIEDSYCLSIPYFCYMPMGGDFVSGFNTSFNYYLADDGTCHYGFNEEGMRSYLECMNAWYEKGWLDPQFDERTSDMFYMIDTAAVYSGRVPMWYGLQHQLGNLMDNSNGDTTNPINGICVYGAPQPINDVYGDESTQGHEPFAYFLRPQIEGGVVITNKAEEKDIAALCAAIDYLYSKEGGMERTVGLSREVQAEVQDPFYAEHNLNDGAWHEEGDTAYIHVTDLHQEDGLGDAAAAIRLNGGGRQYEHIDSEMTSVEAHTQDMWQLYPITGMLGTEVTAQLTADQAEAQGLVGTNSSTYVMQAMSDFIRGEVDIEDDAAWNDYVTTLDGYGVQTYCEWIDEITGAGK